MNIYIYSWLLYHKRSKVCMPYQVKVIQEVPYCVVGNPLEVKKGVNGRNWICEFYFVILLFFFNFYNFSPACLTLNMTNSYLILLTLASHFSQFFFLPFPDEPYYDFWSEVCTCTMGAKLRVNFISHDWIFSLNLLHSILLIWNFNSNL